MCYGCSLECKSAYLRVTSRVDLWTVLKQFHVLTDSCGMLGPGRGASSLVGNRIFSIRKFVKWTVPSCIIILVLFLQRLDWNGNNKVRHAVIQWTIRCEVTFSELFRNNRVASVQSSWNGNWSVRHFRVAIPEKICVNFGVARPTDADLHAIGKNNCMIQRAMFPIYRRYKQRRILSTFVPHAIYKAWSYTCRRLQWYTNKLARASTRASTCTGLFGCRPGTLCITRVYSRVQYCTGRSDSCAERASISHSSSIR